VPNWMDVDACKQLPPPPYAFSVQSYDGAPRGKVSGKMMRHYAGLQVFTRLLRSRIFPSLPFDLAVEQQYRHLVAFGALTPCSWLAAAHRSSLGGC
jgi:hypothetical protein